MKTWFIKLLILIPILLSSSCKLFQDDHKEGKTLGCTFPTANNYNPDATEDDGSCEFFSDSSSFILITYDSGLTWEKKCINIPVSTIIDISIVDENNIWVCTSPMIIGQSKAQILHSNDGGYSWTAQYEYTENNDFFNYIEMFDKNNGIAMGDGKDNYPLFLKTNDGGSTWIKTITKQIGLSGDTWKRLDFVDNKNGYFFESGVNPQKLLKTQNSGNSWIETSHNEYVQALGFYNNDIGITINTMTNSISRTIDGGDSWENISVNLSGWGNDVAFHTSDPNRVWISDGDVYYSNDMGSTWTKEYLSPQPIKIFDIYVGGKSVWSANLWKDRELFANKDILQNIWEQVQIPINENDVIEGIIDGVGDDIIVLPGHAFIPSD